MTSADKWLKQELDELEEAQRMINDAISTFDDPTPFIEPQANGDLKKKSCNVSNSQPLSEADQSVAELLSSLNIEEESPKQEKFDLPDPPSLDDLLIEENTENSPPVADLPEKSMSKPVKKTTGVSSVTIQLKGKSPSNRTSKVSEPENVETPPPVPPLPAEDTNDEPVVAELSTPLNQSEENKDEKTENGKTESTVSKRSSVPSNVDSATDSEVSSCLPTLTLENQMNNDQKKELSDLEKDLEFYTQTLLGNIDKPKDKEFYGFCAICNQPVEGEKEGCKALGNIYHIKCFNCSVCSKSIHGVQFYSSNDKLFCQDCYLSSLEKCCVCDKVITEKILRANGKAYHPECFSCCVCGTLLEGKPFTTDDDGNIYAVDCYYEKHGVRCDACGKAITPEEGSEEAVRIVALGKNFCVKCYKCEKCDVKFEKGEEKGCYPLEGVMMCLKCNNSMVAVN